MSRRALRAAACVAGALGAVVAPAGAATWSPTKAYDKPLTCDRQARAAGDCLIEPAPSVAVAATGTAVAAWDDAHGRVRVATAARAGRFGAAATLAAAGYQPAATLAPDGDATVVWIGKGGTLRFARRPHGARRFGPTTTLAKRGDPRGDDAPTAAAQADGSVVVVYESGRRIRAVTISARGVPSPPTTLGRGGFDHDSVRAAPDGTLAACCVDPVVTDPNVPPDTASKIALFRAATGWRLIDAGAVGHDQIETVFGTTTDLVLGTTKVAQGGDAGVLGVPSVARAGADDVLAAPLRAPVTRADHALAPNVALDGSGRAVLLFQEKAKAGAFSRAAPVYASVAAPGATALAGRTRLDARLGYEPAVRPFGAGAIGVWQDPDDRWGVAIERRGVFAHAPAPPGLGPSAGLGEDFNYAYAFQAAGSHAVLAWVARDGTVRVSEISGS